MMADTRENKNWLEWTVTIISIMLVIFTFSFLTYEVIYQEQTSPDIKVSLGKLQKLENYYAIPVKAKNQGTQTAQKVRIEISVESATGQEKAEIEFDYLPGKSNASGWVSFKENPDGKTLKTHVLGYITP